MDSFELNKVAGAVLGTLLFALGTGFVAELIYHPKPAGSAGYALPEPHGETAAPAAEAKVEPIAVRLASATVDKGKAGAKACSACHSFEQDGPNKIGPALWNVVERPKGTHAGFDYSAGMKEKGGDWSYADLDHFLENPKGYVKGTKMAFQGIGDPKQRADVVLYLHSLSDAPKPLPVAEKTGESANDTAKDETKGTTKDGARAPAPAPDATKNVEEAAKPADKATGAAEGRADGQKAGQAPADGQAAQPGPGEATDTDRPGGSGKAKSQIETGDNPPIATPSGDATMTEPTAPETPPVTRPPAQPDPAAERKAEEVREGGKAQ